MVLCQQGKPPSSMEHRQPSCDRLRCRDDDPPRPPPPPPPPPFACAGGAKSNVMARSAFAASRRRARRQCVARGTADLGDARYSFFRGLGSGQQRPVAGLRSGSAKTLPLTRGERGRGANAAAVDANNATRSVNVVIVRTIAKPTEECSPKNTRAARSASTSLVINRGWVKLREQVKSTKQSVTRPSAA